MGEAKMIILGMDTSSRVNAWALADTELPRARRIIDHGKFELPVGATSGKKLRDFHFEVNKLRAMYQPDMIAYEMPHLRGAGSFILVKITGMLDIIADTHDLKIGHIHTSTLKKMATGRGNAKKPEMVIAAREFIQDGEEITHDEADAIHVAICTADEMEEQEG